MNNKEKLDEILFYAQLYNVMRYTLDFFCFQKYNAAKSQPLPSVKRKATDLHDLVKAKKTKGK